MEQSLHQGVVGEESSGVGREALGVARLTEGAEDPANYDFDPGGTAVDMSKATGSFSVHRTLYSTTEGSPM